MTGHVDTVEVSHIAIGQGSITSACNQHSARYIWLQYGKTKNT
jgi:hypothetical protein